MIRRASFHGLYNVRIWLRNGQLKNYKRVTIDNEQFKLSNLRLTDEKGEAVLFVKSDISEWEIDSRNCN